MSDQTRRALADAIHSHAFDQSQDPRAAAQLTDLILAMVDRELTWYALVDSQRALLRRVKSDERHDSNVHVLGDRPSGGEAA